ncbi:hypothetical protein MHU86_9277 [Fragilaria crotonensis]|nr:hypothetical protein MHU86_9277 [Fragilaria crotonensis]
MKTYAVVLALFVGADSFAPAFQSRRTFGVVTSTGAEEDNVAEAEPVVAEEPAPEPEPVPEPEPEPEPELEFQALTRPIPGEGDDENGFSQIEKDRISENAFECHGFFPDLRTEAQLPPSVLKFREQPKSEKELAAIKAKYASMSEADAAFSILVDLGMMEDYDKLGEYSDDFPDDAL